MSALVADLSPVSAWANASLWDREYQDMHAIPSSHRVTPSHALARLLPRTHVALGASVLDAGAGPGRHSVLLARAGLDVHAVDSSPAACALLAERTERERLSIRTDTVALGEHEVPDATYDLIIDSYVSCHILDPVARLDYLNALLGRLRPGGHLFTSCMGSGDAYYRHCARRGGESSSRATDPLNGITKLLRSRNEFASEVAALATVAAVGAETFDDAVNGGTYRREVLAAVLTRT
ncbi:MAG: class I SAM-dependent methyltransferase [Acidimicrobiales bacterium]